MRVALVHEFLTQLGGAEKVLESFHELFPDAPVYTLFHDPEKTGNKFAAWDVRPSFLQSAKRYYKWSLPLMSRAIESFDLSGYDLVLSDSSAFAKGAMAKKPTTHICYCHTPTRYLWESMDGYVAGLPYGRLVKWAVKPYLRHYLKKWDYRAAQRPDFFIANSRTVQKRIKTYYHRDSEVIYPPVDTELFRPEGKKQEYFVTGSRLEPYKKINLVIEAFNKLNLPLKVVGDGSELPKLKKLAGPNIEFFGKLSEEQLKMHFNNAQAFIFPALEDAGIMVLEALSSGTPVIGYARGGTGEFIRHRENGILFENQTVSDIVSAVQRFKPENFDSQKLRASAMAFAKPEFQRNISAFIAKHT